jgi:hypothetical protein
MISSYPVSNTRIISLSFLVKYLPYLTGLLIDKYLFTLNVAGNELTNTDFLLYSNNPNELDFFLILEPHDLVLLNLSEIKEFETPK